ncbi:unnamed protein product, partial [Staurois parvus]
HAAQSISTIRSSGEYRLILRPRTSGEPASFPGGSAGVPILLVPGKPFTAIATGL